MTATLNSAHWCHALAQLPAAFVAIDRCARTSDTTVGESSFCKGMGIEQWDLEYRAHCWEL